MDARRTSTEALLLNELIDLINKNIKEDVNEFLINENLCEDIKKISGHIYQYAQIHIDLDSIFSKQNFLSIDIVPLPNIPCIVVLIQEGETVLPHTFPDILHRIKSVMVQRKKENNAHHDIYKNIQKILFKYDLNCAG